MSFGSILIVLGCFLLGGAYSIFKADHETKGRTGPQLVLALVLLAGAGLSIAGGVLRLV